MWGEKQSRPKLICDINIMITQRHMESTVISTSFVVYVSVYEDYIVCVNV